MKSPAHFPYRYRRLLRSRIRVRVTPENLGEQPSEVHSMLVTTKTNTTSLAPHCTIRMFIHGARAMLLRVKYDTGRGEWARQLELRVPRNKAVVAVANKLARIAWAVLASGNEYHNVAVAAA